MANDHASPRDPTFYTWHGFIDEVFQRYKSTLPAYTREELEFQNVVIQDVQVKSGNDTNIFNTMWVNDTVNITEGISVKMKKMLGVKTVYYDFVHLGHKDFEFHIKVRNNNQKNVSGTVRIFLAPEYRDWHYVKKYRSYSQNKTNDALNKNQCLEPAFNKYRKLFIELDKFVHVLRPGMQTIVRGPNSSSVTIPYKQLFKTKEDALMATKSVSTEEHLSWAACGWPDYLQIPRGTIEGFQARLFVMISNFTKDRSSDNIQDFGNSEKDSTYCGRPNETEPDGKPMGYPFDRDFGDQNTYLSDFIIRKKMKSEPITNMKAINVVIKHLPNTNNPETGQSIIYRDSITSKSSHK